MDLVYLDDQNVEIYAVSRTTPDYMVIGQNLNLRLVIGQYKVRNLRCRSGGK